MAVKNKVQLITYPDSLGGNLKTLKQTLDTYFQDLFQGGIHILPPYPSSGDRGFAPITYFEIEPAFGTWEDVRSLGKEYDILLDLMVNHVSQKSKFFQDFLKKGRKSDYADFFITLDKLWADGQPVQEDINKMFLRRKKPYSEFTIAESGKKERVWTTFGKTDPSEQIDIDVNSPLAKEYFISILNHFKEQRVKTLRLDAVGYVIKKIGTSCFFVEPEIYQFLEWFKKASDLVGIELLLEVHAHYSIQYKLAERGYWIYDFILPYLILETLINQSNKNLIPYLKERPKNQFTMLDCHDGVPVKPDLDDFIHPKEARKIVDLCLSRGSNLSYVLSDEHKSEDGFDVHQIRGTYYSMLNQDDNAYIAARAIQFFTPGIPQVYYVGLLAGTNDYERGEQTGDGREINRHNYTLEEVEKACGQQVVQRLFKLIRFRNSYDAFNGEFKILDSQENEIRLSWKKHEKYCTLYINLATYQTIIDYIDDHGKLQTYFV